MPFASLFGVRIVQIGGAVGQDRLKIYFFIGQRGGPAVRVGHSYGIEARAADAWNPPGMITNCEAKAGARHCSREIVQRAQSRPIATGGTSPPVPLCLHIWLARIATTPL